MTIPTGKIKTPTRIFQRIDLNLEIETTILLEKYEQQQKADGRAEETISSRLRALKQCAIEINIDEPETVKIWLSERKWSSKTKIKFCDTYSSWLKFRGKTWNAPTYEIQDKIPFIPTEQEIDLLIAGCGKTTATVLQMLKETGMRIGELCILKWTDLDSERRTINVTPEKGSSPRIIGISTTLVTMLSKLSKRHSPNIFQPEKKMLREYFSVQRKEVATKLGNERLLKIHFHTFRHWKGTMEYYKTLDLKHVQYILGHKTSSSCDKYVHYVNELFHIRTEEWTCKIAHNEAEEIKLIEAGFTFVNKREEPYTAFYKKRK
jgi:integrase